VLLDLLQPGQVRDACIALGTYWTGTAVFPGSTHALLWEETIHKMNSVPFFK